MTCIRGLVFSEEQADNGTAAIIDHHSNGQSNHSQRKDHRMDDVSVGAKIACIGNKNLVNNVENVLTRSEMIYGTAYVPINFPTFSLRDRVG